MKFLKEKELIGLTKEDLVNHLKETAKMLLDKYDTDCVELDSCQETDDGEMIVYNGQRIGVNSVDVNGVKYNDCISGNILGTITFEQILEFDIKLIHQILNNYQMTILNEIL